MTTDLDGCSGKPPAAKPERPCQSSGRQCRQQGEKEIEEDSMAALIHPHAASDSVVMRAALRKAKL
jgi:hypothetical protein